MIMIMIIKEIFHRRRHLCKVAVAVAMTQPQDPLHHHHPPHRCHEDGLICLQTQPQTATQHTGKPPTTQQPTPKRPRQGQFLGGFWFLK
jgi:hypothetical protein